jgi:hypothetical protein
MKTYVVRNTDNPQADIERGWSGFMGQDWPSLMAAARSLLSDTDYDRDQLDGMSEDEITDVLADYGFDVRYDAQFGTWRHVHHDGLSCWLIYAETLEEAIEMAPEANLGWGGFGHATVGKVELVASLSKTVHIFVCDGVVSE